MDHTFWSEILDPGNARQNPVYAIGVQSDGSIVVGGIVIQCSGAEKPNSLFRLKSDGTYDPSFHFNEVLADQHQIRSILILPDDRILVGVSDRRAWGKPSLSLFSQRGEPLGSFGDYPLNTSADQLIPVDDKGIYLVDKAGNRSSKSGFFLPDGGFSPIVRVHWDGTFDQEFNPDTLLRTLTIADVNLDKEGRLFVVGSLQSAQSPSLMLFTENGSRDTSFECPFQVETIFGFQSSGRVIARLVSGEIVGLKSDGSLDETFSIKPTVPNIFDSFPRGHVLGNDSIWFGTYFQDTTGYFFKGTTLSPGGHEVGQAVVLPGDVPFGRAACVVFEDDTGRLLVAYNAVRHSVLPLSPGLVRILPFSDVPSKPVIYNQKENIQLRAGERLVLKARASGTQLKFQWFQDGMQLPGEIKPVLDIPDIPPERTGVYSVRIQNETGETEMVIAEVNIDFFHSGKERIQVRNIGDPNPFLLTTNYLLIPNERIPARIGFIKGAQLQWLHNDVPIPGATERELTFNISHTDQAGDYRLRVTHQDKIYESHPTTLYVNPEKELDPPILVEAPDNVSLMDERRHSLEIKAVGRNLTYEWKRNGEVILDGPSSRIDIPSMDATWEGTYEVMVSNSMGSVTTDPFQIGLSFELGFVAKNFPVVFASAFTQQAFFSSNSTAAHDRIFITHNGEEVFSRQFQVESRGRRPGYYKDAPTIADAGQYTATIYRGDKEASLTFESTVVALVEPRHLREVVQGEPMNLSFYHGLEDEKVLIQWKLNGKAMGGQTSNELHIPASELNHQGYYFAEVLYENNVYRTEAKHITVVPLASLPSIPHLVTIEVGDDGNNKVSWEKAKQADSYLVDRSLDGGSTWAGIGSTSDLFLTDPTHHKEGRVGYRVIAKNNAGISNASQPVWIGPGGGNQSTATMSGRVFFMGRNEHPIPHASVVLSQDGNTLQVVTDSQGRYQFEVPLGKPVEITVNMSSYSLPNNGVDVADILNLRKHILNRYLLNSSERWLAADVNRDHSIDVGDILEMRKVILNKNDAFSSDRQGNKHSIWRLVSKNFTQLTPERAFDEVTNHEGYRFDEVTTDIAGIDFAAIKLGDCNGDWQFEGNVQPLSVPSPKYNKSIYSERHAATKVVPGDSAFLEKPGHIQVPIQLTEDINLLGVQFGFHWDSNQYELIEIASPTLPFFNPSIHTNIKAGNAIVAWDDPILSGVDIETDTPLLLLTFKKRNHATQNLIVECVNSVVIPSKHPQPQHPDDALVGDSIVSNWKPNVEFVWNENGELRITFDTLSGVKYSVEKTENLTLGNWKSIALVKGSGNREGFKDSVSSESTGFYRISIITDP